MTDNMKKVLELASGEMGIAQGRLINESMQAQRNGWIKYVGTPQNSQTGRYRITKEGMYQLGA